jgi:2,4-dienoyl-CoA reductase-like NADH-dependent reductase (Old Yellow Enzyme family)
MMCTFLKKNKHKNGNEPLEPFNRTKSISFLFLKREEDSMAAESLIFSSFRIQGLTLKNRLTMAPLYLGYAHSDGTVSQLTLDHYTEMAGSGVALVVVEHTMVHLSGIATPTSLRVDDDRYIPGLSELARVIHEKGAIAFLQINHCGRYAFVAPEKWTPSPIRVGETMTKEMTKEQIDQAVQSYAAAAKRVREAGFDGVEIHGGMAYLIVQFLSPRTNHRTDLYGGSIENRMRFPLAVFDAVKAAVGDDFPVGYRFSADEEMPDGLHPEETVLLAQELEKRGAAYLSVMAGSYDAYSLSEYREKEKNEAHMAHYAGEIKRAAPDTPIITAGRIKTPEIADKILREGTADLIGLARVLLADPLWPQKAKGEVSEAIVECDPNCSFCMKRTGSGKPAYCARWDKARRQAFLAKVGETLEEAM